MSGESIALKAFISYSRKDGMDFVEQLAVALEVVGVKPLIDRHTIAGGEDWRKRIGNLIAEADSVVFVITPESIASTVCDWEIAKSADLGKKLIPVVPADLHGVIVPERLGSLNYVFFYPDASTPGAGFGKGLADLSDALRTDLTWVRAHTRYGQRASDWLVGNRAASRLLSGNDVFLAKTWLAERQPDAPEITDDVREFIDASERVENERKSIERKRIKERENTVAEIEAYQQKTELYQMQFKRSLLGGSLIAFILATFGCWMLVEAWKSQAKADLSFRQATKAQRQARESERQAKGLLDLVAWIGNKNLNGDRQATQEQKSAMIELCNEAIAITTAIAQKEKTSGGSSDEDKFWELYAGALFVVEIFQRLNSSEDVEIKLEVGGKSEIEASMVRFGRILKGEREGNLVDAAQDVEDACIEFQQRLERELSDLSSD